MKTVSLFCAILFTAISATAATADQAAKDSTTVGQEIQWQRVGSGEMRWTLFRLYHITLQTPDGEFRENRFPLALEIRYHRDIDRQHLVAATADQWDRLGIPQERYTQWLDRLTAIWPDVQEGDSLRIEVFDGASSRFFHNGEMIGELGDQEFAIAFTDIWLSTATSRPDLRRKLIGEDSGSA